jgi:hypothetical protein
VRSPTRLRAKTHLSLPRLPQERLVARAERRTRTSQPGAAADTRKPSKGSIIARADATSVEVLCAVRHGRGPLPNDGPQILVGARQATPLAARCGYVL